MTWRPPAHALRAWRRNRPIPVFNQLDLLSAGHPQDGFQQTGHMAFMIGVCAGMHPECVHCTVRQLEQAQAEGVADSGRRAGKNDATDVTGCMRLRLNALAGELGDGWSYGPAFAGLYGEPTVPVFYGDRLAGNLVFPAGGPLRRMWGPCGDRRHLYQKPCRRIGNLLRQAAGIDPLPDVNRRPKRVTPR